MTDSPADIPVEAHLEAQCPRCGYDLHGLATSWRESCPLAGNCSECGLAFHWGDLLSKKLNIPPWCVESPVTPGIHGVAWAMCRTLLMSLRPWRFWRELKMTHHPRWKRVIAYPLITILLLYMFCSISVGFAAFQQIQRGLSYRGTAKLPPVVLAIRSTILPLSSQSLWTWPNGRAGNSPRQIVFQYKWYRMGKTMVEAIKRDKFFFPGGLHTQEVRGFQALLLILLSPLGFLALPISRRVCKVRRRHVERIWLYSLPLIALPITAEFTGQMIRGSLLNVFDLLLIITGLLLVIWWGFASQRYLKMQWPWLVGIAVVAVPITAVMLFVEAYIIAVNGMGW